MRKTFALLLLCVLTLPPLAAAGEARGDKLTVVYADSSDRACLGTVFQAWREAERDLRGLGLRLPPVRLEAASSAANFARRAGEPWFVAASTHGATIHTQRLGALAASGRLGFTLRHEAFHAAQPPRLPRWLAEGLARVFSGEASEDLNAPTGLEQRSNAQLDALLAGRDESRLQDAYREATRRALRLVRERGWKKALAAR